MGVCRCWPAVVVVASYLILRIIFGTWVTPTVPMPFCEQIVCCAPARPYDHTQRTFSCCIHLLGMHLNPEEYKSVH
jgi:hypothetical protein